MTICPVCDNPITVPGKVQIKVNTAIEKTLQNLYEDIASSLEEKE